jgi:hypothetical protein
VQGRRDGHAVGLQVLLERGGIRGREAVFGHPAGWRRCGQPLELDPLVGVDGEALQCAQRLGLVAERAVELVRGGSLSYTRMKAMPVIAGRAGVRWAASG